MDIIIKAMYIALLKKDQSSEAAAWRLNNLLKPDKYKEYVEFLQDFGSDEVICKKLLHR